MFLILLNSSAKLQPQMRDPDICSATRMVVSVTARLQFIDEWKGYGLSRTGRPKISQRAIRFP